LVQLEDRERRERGEREDKQQEERREPRSFFSGWFNLWVHKNSHFSRATVETLRMQA